MPSYYDLKMPRVAACPGVPDDEYGAYMTAAAAIGQPVTTLPSFSHCVTATSPKPLRTAVYNVARFFRREFGYDAVQYSRDYPDPEARAFLWTSHQDYWPDHKETVIGACCFYPCEYTNVEADWSLAWVWLHPFERRRGHLKTAWPYFCQRFGCFWLSQPLSTAMDAFLTHVGYALPPVHYPPEEEARQQAESTTASTT